MEKSLLLLQIGMQLRVFTSQRALNKIMGDLRQLPLSELKRIAVENFGVKGN